MKTLSLTALIVFLLVPNWISRLTLYKNELYRFSFKEISAHGVFKEIDSGHTNQLAFATSQTVTTKLLLKSLVTFITLQKKNTTYYNNHFVEFKNLKLIV